MSNISEATTILEELLGFLDDAYWESNSANQKDRIYDIISALHKELSELAKLSIQDHHLDYEAITVEFKSARTKLSELRRTINDCIFRSCTASNLESCISATVTLSSN